MPLRPRLVAFLVVLIAALAAIPAGSALADATLSTTPVTSVDLADYGLVTRVQLPGSANALGGNTACANSSDTFADEASAVAYDPNGSSGAGSLFVLGDGGNCVVQTTLGGIYIDSMTLATGNSPAGNAFYDTEGITYVGQHNGKPQLVITEERYRDIDEFDYTPSATLALSDATAVKLGTTIGNIGLEGVTYDPASSNAAGCTSQTVTPEGGTPLAGTPVTGNFCQGFIAVKEKQPEDIFKANVDWGPRGAQSTDSPLGTATNGGPGENEGSSAAPTALFTPTLAGLNDFSDIFALSNLPSLDTSTTHTINGSDTDSYDGDILIDSQESGSIEELTRTGTIVGRLDLFPNPASGLDVVDETHEGVTMDEDGNLYVVSEDGAGPGKPELEIYAPESAANDASPTAVTLASGAGTLPSTTTTSNGPVKLTGLSLTDADGIGTDTYAVTATDANNADVSNLFKADHTGLYVASGASLANAASPVTLHVSVSDPNSTNSTSVVTSQAFALTVTPAAPVTGAESKIIISEVDPSGSGAGNNSYGGDWFELTNTGTQSVSLTGWSADDSHEVAGSFTLNGVSSIAPGESVVFVQADTTPSATTTPAQTVAAFRSDWGLASNAQVGYYSNADGLSQSGDEVNVYDAGNNLVSGVSFGASENKVSFDNSAGTTGTISTFSDAGGDDGSFTDSHGETGSPGFADIAPTVAITEVDPAGSGTTTYKADWFELTNDGVHPVNLTGWTMDDSSASSTTSVPMSEGSGSPVLAPGTSIVFIEDTSATAGDAALESAFENAWFPGGAVPSNFRIGTYGGSGVGLSTGGDGVTVFDANATTVDEVSFRAFTGPGTFQNPGLAGVGGSASEMAAPVLTTVAAPGVAGAFTDPAAEVGSPGTTKASIAITEIDPAGLGTSTYAEDWFELTNTGTTPEEISGWKMDDSSDAFASAVALTPSGASDLLGAGQSIVFAEHNTGNVPGETAQSLQTAFQNAWFPGGTAPANFLFGTYSGSGVGLSTGGDGVHIFDSAQTEFAGVTFGAAPNGATFDNTSGTPTASVRGVKGARPSQNGAELGSPGTIAADTRAPTLTVAGNQGTYASTGTVNITCTATDDTFGSGIQTPCTGVSGAAAGFGTGTHTVTLSATDFAGNTGTAQVTFTVQPPATTTTGPTTTGTTTTTGAPTTTTGGAPTTTSTRSAPVPKIGSLGPKATARRLERGLTATLTDAKAKSTVTLTIRAEGKKLDSFFATVSNSGKVKVTFHLSTRLVARYKGKKLTLRFTVTDRNGHKHTITKTLRVS